MASKKHFFKRRPVATAAAVVTQIVAATSAYAGIGFVDAADPQGNPIRVQTFFSTSPSGLFHHVPVPPETRTQWTDKNGIVHQPLFPNAYNPNGYQGSGKAFRKFVDPLSPLGILPAQKANTLTDKAATSLQKTSKYVPLASAEKWVSPNGVLTGDDYYELACLEYTERVHSDIRKPTTFRGYVQIETNLMKAARLANPATAVSKGIPLFYPLQKWPNTQTVANLAPGAVMPGADWRGQDDWRDLSRPIMIQDTDARGALLFDASGKPVMKQAMGVDEPHYAGPAVLAVQGVPTRYKFYNLNPAGRPVLQTDAVGNPVRDLQGNLVVLKRNGNLPIPVDASIPGAGVGIDGITTYTQNRIAIHLHGGDTPWVSDGTAHQWFAPVGESDATVPGTLASDLGGDPALLNHFLYGASYARVPDMADPGPGTMTFYYPNGQSARLMWYHDHALGITRLNAYMVEAAPYWLTSPTELDLMGPTPGINPAGRGVIPGLLDTIPLVLQEKSFVPNDIAMQDLAWNTTAWGEPGDLWYAHVYETVQDPALMNGWSPVGRWHYGPWFWPVYPALYALPTGSFGDETLTPENWNDTPIINGVIYPYVEVEPKPYRLRMLNGSNDRMFTFNLFDAGPPVIATDAMVATFPDGLMLPGSLTTTYNADVGADLPVPTPSWATVNTTVLNPQGAPTYNLTINAGWVADPDQVLNPGKYYPTEVKMVPAALSATPLCAPGVKRPNLGLPVRPDGFLTTLCVPADWPTDGRNGGVPDPSTVGPALYQFMNEGGVLAKLAPTEPLPTNPLYDKGRAAVLNVNTTGIFLGNAQRADVVVDFSQYAGRTLIAYNDMFAPVPAGDPRNDYFTGVGDQSPQGGAEDTLPAIGPNTRTLMQFRVKPTLANGTVPTAADAINNPAKTTLPNLASLTAEIPKAFAATQDPPVVAQAVYNAAYHPTSNCPAIVTPNTTGCWDDVRSYASIYLSSLKQPYFDFVPGNPGKFDAIIVTNGGTGYVTAPQVVFTGGGATTPAIANATLKIGQINVLNPGSGYSVAPGVQISTTLSGGGAVAEATLLVQSAIIANGGSGYITAPSVVFGLPQTATGVRATGTAVLTNGVVTGVTITNPGSGYSAMPTVTIGAPPAGGTQATATASGGVSAFHLIPIDPSNPGSAGGGGYTDMTTVTITLTPPDLVGGLAPTLQPVGSVMDVTLATDTKSYTSLPTVTLVGGGGAGAVAQILGITPVTDVNGNLVTPPTNGTTLGRYMIKGKAIQELFDPTFGRLNATFGTELPFTSALTQTTIPLAFIDPPTEIINDLETQIWKLTHNGVDTHPVHFHLMNVQVVNRVGWDGFITPPDPKEIGWNETVIMNPLEDIILALKPKRTAVGGGFGFPQSVRLMDPTQPEGSPFGFTQISITSGLPAQVVNAVMNFGWEYTWHCHILGHEENDFMRALVLNIHEAPPVAPSGLKVNTATGVMPAFVPGQGYAGVPLAWTDNSATEYQQILQRADGATSTTFNTIAVLPANQTSYVDTKVDGPLTYRYQITAVGAAGQAVSPIFNVTTPSIPPAAPSGLVASQVGAGVQLNWVDNSTTETNFVIQQSVNGGAFTAVATMNSATKAAVGGTISYTIPAATTGSVVYRVASNNLAGNANYNSAFATSAAVNVNGAPLQPTSLTGVAISEVQAQLTWTDASTNEASFVVQAKDLTANAATFTTIGTASGLPNSGSLASFVAPVLNGHSYMFQVAAVGLGATPQTSAYTTSAIVPVKFLPAAPTSLTATIVSPTLITIKWTDAANNETNYTVEVSADGGVTWLPVSTVAGATGTGTLLSSNFTTPVFGNAYLFRVNANNAAGQTQTQSAPVVFAPSLTGLTAVSSAPNTVTLNWVDGGPLETGYKIERQIGAAGVWTLLGTTAANIKTYTAIGLTAGTAYNFRITPVNVAGAVINAGSPAVVPVTTQALPAAPTAVTVTATSPTAVNVAWTDASTNETSFQVQRLNGTVWTTVAPMNSTTGAATGAALNTPVTTGLVTKTAYSFRVVPMAGTLPGTPSATVNVTMP
jgi:FtsP/CotA-like multicopper oxidase with cupredoxin domain